VCCCRGGGCCPAGAAVAFAANLRLSSVLVLRAAPYQGDLASRCSCRGARRNAWLQLPGPARHHCGHGSPAALHCKLHKPGAHAASHTPCTCSQSHCTCAHAAQEQPSSPPGSTAGGPTPSPASSPSTTPPGTGSPMWGVLLPSSPAPPGSKVRPAGVRPSPFPIPAGQQHVPDVEAADPSAYCVEDLSRAPFRVQYAGAVATGYDTTFTFQVGCWVAGGAGGLAGLRCHPAGPRVHMKPHTSLAGA
jgi:hypothetical protein